MNYILREKNLRVFVEVTDPGLLIQEPNDILSLSADLPEGILILRKSMISEIFFDLRSGFAGEITQKVSNYNLRLGILGDFSGYESRALRDFIRESNRLRRVVFAADINEAIDRLST